LHAQTLELGYGPVLRAGLLYVIGVKWKEYGRFVHLALKYSATCVARWGSMSPNFQNLVTFETTWWKK